MFERSRWGGTLQREEFPWMNVSLGLWGTRRVPVGQSSQADAG
jgi:hypothetical protein